MQVALSSWTSSGQRASTMAKKIRRGILWSIAALVLMAIFPPLDPTYYLIDRTKCLGKPKDELIQMAREEIKGSTEFLVRNFGESASAFEDADMVQFYDQNSKRIFSYDVTFRTPAGRLIEIGIGPDCFLKMFFPTYLPAPPI